jgi:CubicO group peptidase (beta-lactamase class C family)
VSDLEPINPKTADELGLMVGSPPPDDRIVTFENWGEWPYLRWAMQHAREVLPTALVDRGDGPVWELPRRLRDVSDWRLEHAGHTWTFDEITSTTYVDGLMVVHDGTVVLEHYANGMGPRTRHLCQSVSKSLTSTLVGVLQDEGVLSDTTLVTDAIGELRGTVWDRCTVEHLLDMRAGVAFDESDYTDEDSQSWRGFRAVGWLTREDDDPTPHEYVAGMRPQSAHGAEYEYRSILTDVLGWVVERATGRPFADVFAELVWQPLGAASDADLALGPSGFALVDGGFCVTLGDLARYGLMHLRRGDADGRRVLSAAWTERVVGTNPTLSDLFESEREGLPDDAYYRDQWWVIDPQRGARAGFGIHGQQVLVDDRSRSVVARFSSQPDAVNRPLGGLIETACLSLAEWAAEPAG